MNNGRKIGLLLITFVAFVALIVWLFSSGGGTGGRKTVFTSNNWVSRYQIDQKHPYGLYHFNRLLKLHVGLKTGVKRIDNVNEFDSLIFDGTHTFMFVGSDFGIQTDEMDSVMADVNRGGTLVMAFEDLTDNLYPYFFREKYFYSDYSEELTVTNGKRRYQFYNVFQNDTISKWWKAFDAEELRRSDFESLSGFLELDNCVQIRFGSGKVILHTNPELFYNYQVLRRDGNAYCDYFLSKIPNDKEVLWMEFGRLPDDFDAYDTLDESTNSKQDNSYLQYLLGNRGMRAALLTLVLGVILFLLFRTRRIRPVVPVIPRKKNVTLAYAETITSIFYSKRNAYGLLNVLKKNFYNTVSRHFFIDLHRREGNREIMRLSEKSNIPAEEIEELIELFETKKAFSVDEHYVAEASRRQRSFYERSGILTEFTARRVEKKKRDFRRQLWLPALLIFGGISITLFGFYYLTQSRAIGITLWPLGIIWIIAGIIQLRKPLLSINSEELTFYPLMRKNKTYRREDIERIRVHEKSVVFQMRNGKKLKINYWEMSYFDKKQFKRYISGIQNVEL